MRHHDLFFTLILFTRVDALHHMKRTILQRANSSSASTPLIISNLCGETIYPGLITQAGTGPAKSGFQLQPGANLSQTVSADWQGRVWGRTNCTFNSQGTSNGGGKACASGDCNGALQCIVTVGHGRSLAGELPLIFGQGNVPVTLAEFTLNGGDDQTYFDISLVDGYNLPLAISLVTTGQASTDDIPPNLTSPSCIGTASELAPAGYNPYTSGMSTFLGTNASFPLPFDNTVSTSTVADWCPWDLQVNTPKSPGDGVYPYPDSNIARPAFDPCYSACAKYNSDKYCCNGKYNSPSACKTNYYSTAAKNVCPDAYSYAYDDQTSTFIIPSGAGFQVTFCPGGRSTTILKSKAAQISQLASSGTVSGSSGSTATASSLASPNLDARGLCAWLAITMAASVVLYA